MFHNPIQFRSSFWLKAGLAIALVALAYVFFV